MRVICVEDRPIYNSPQATWILKIGEIYTVVDDFKHNGFDYYELQEQPGVGYCVEFFIPLSSISETEFERNYKKELV